MEVHGADENSIAPFWQLILLYWLSSIINLHPEHLKSLSFAAHFP